MEEPIKQLLETRDWLIKKIDGNEANIKMMLEYYQPQIDKIDELIKIFVEKD